MSKWIIIGAAVLVLAILGDRLLAKRSHVPLSRSKPRPTGQTQKDHHTKAPDRSEMDLQTKHNNSLELQNQGDGILTRLIEFVSRIPPKKNKSEKK